MEKTGNRSVADLDRAEPGEQATEPGQEGRHRNQATPREERLVPH
jgi:hypothetical protein